MKLIRFGTPDHEKPGIILDDGRRIDVSAFEADDDEGFFGGDGLKQLAVWVKANAATAPTVDASVRLGIAGLGESRQVARAFTGLA
jgi:hypothetical protein